jgi:FdrA protein
VSTARLRVFAGAYRDSLLLLSATRSMRAADGVEWGAAVMATEANVADLGSAGFGVAELESADANDLVLAVRAAGVESAEAALDQGHTVLFAEAGRDEGPGPDGQPPRTVDGAAARLSGANVAIVSVPGQYAALAAHQALTSGLHVLLFSDNVSAADEVALKERASGLGLLVMGPGAGTAVLGGVGLGFANAVRPGRVGVVAAAGTGAQEVMTLLDHWDIGVSQVIGVGGRDLSAAVGGLMAADAVRALDRDPGTDAILLVSKPPDPDVAARVVAEARHKPVVAACVGMPADVSLAGASLARTLEEGAAAVAERLGRAVPDLADGLTAAAARVAGPLAVGRTAVRGFFSGGTLCYEAQVILRDELGDVYSNIPLDSGHGLAALGGWPGEAGGATGVHVCLDLGEEEYTLGRPHPMIDPAARREILAEQALAPDIAVVLLDVVLGYGSHPDPAGEITDICADIVADGAAVVAYVLGTKADPQGYEAQRAKLAEAGVIVTPTAARAAWTAAAIAARRPEVAGRGLGGGQP